MTRREGNCDRVHDLWEAQASGAVLSEEDRRLVDAFLFLMRHLLETLLAQTKTWYLK